MSQNLGGATNIVFSSPALSGTETIIGQFGPIIPNNDTSRVLLIAAIVVLSTAATALQFRIRRGATLADPAIFTSNNLENGNNAASNTNYTIMFMDSLASLATVFYSLTLTPTGANCGINNVTFAGLLL
jgi:hypothetical protein